MISVRTADSKEHGFNCRGKLSQAQQKAEITPALLRMLKKKIEFASTDRVEQYRAEIDRVLWHTASILKEDISEEEWLSHAFVSDESTLADFFFDDSELRRLSEALSLPRLLMKDSFIYVARTLRHKDGGACESVLTNHGIDD